MSPADPPSPAVTDYSGDHFRRLVESATDYAIFSIDLERRVRTWNPGAERVFGFPDDEIIGKSADILFTPEDRALAAPQREASTALAAGKALDERWHLRKGGERFFGSGMMFPLLDEEKVCVGFVKIARDLTERKLAAEELHRAKEHLEEKVRERTVELEEKNRSLHEQMARRIKAEEARKEVARRIVNAQEDERLRLSRELHDEIGQRIAAVMLEVGALSKDLKGTPGEGALPKIQNLIEQIGTELHAVAVQLRPTSLDDLGLKRSLEAYVGMWSRRSGIVVTQHYEGLDRTRVSQEIELTVYRVVQESLTNILKHAGAARTTVVASLTDSLLMAVVEDDGRGFEVEGKLRNGGLGLLGMRERVALVGGELTVESQPGKGTTIHARIPLSPRP